jgi:hypothetical protein
MASAGTNSPYATNSAGVTTTPIDFTNAYAPTLQLYHGGSIVVNGNVIGRIDSWQAAGAYTREGVHVYEVNGDTWGKPVDYVPGRATGFNITFTRSEVWEYELEKTLGYGNVWQDLTDQNYPFTAVEYLYRGSVPYRSWHYYGCWFTEKTPSAWEAAGDGILKVNCGMAYIRRHKTL